MSLQFLNMKSWHPANKTNQRRIWIAEQNARDRAQREEEAAAEVRQSAELQRFQQLATASSSDPAAARRAADKQQLGFMYAPPPGLQKPGDAAASGADAEDDDADVAAFRRKVDKRRVSGEAPNEDSREGQRNLERYVGRRPDESLTIKAQVERFPFLKDAPVEGQFTDAVKVNFKPVGKQIRNVRCMRCGEWGHQSGDRECTLRDANPHDAARQLMEDPMAQLKQRKRELVLKKASLPLEMQEEPGKEEFEILLSDDDDDDDGHDDGSRPSDAEREFLAKLSSKEKKKLLKKLKRQQEQAGGESSDDSDSDASAAARRHKKRRKKGAKEEKKSKRKAKHKHRSRESGDEDVERTSRRRSDDSVRIYPPDGVRATPVLQALQTVGKPVAVVGVLSASYDSQERVLAFTNRLIGRHAFQASAVAAACAGAKDAVPLAASVHLYYDEARACAYLLGIVRPESQWFERDAAEVATTERERFKVQLLLHTCCNMLFVVQESARLPTSLLKDARALASEKQQVLTQLQSTPVSAKASKKGGGSAASSVFAPGRCVPLVLYVVPAPDEVYAAKSKASRPPLAAYCKAFEGKLSTLFRSLRGGLVGSVRMRDALTATNLSKERRVFNLDPSHCAVVVAAKTAGGLEARLLDLLDSLDADVASEHTAVVGLDALLAPLEDDDTGFPRAMQFMHRFVDLLLASSGSLAAAPSSAPTPAGSKDAVRVDLLTVAQWLKGFQALVKTLHRMDAKRRQDALALQPGGEFGGSGGQLYQHEQAE